MDKFCCDELTSIINDPMAPLDYDKTTRSYSLVCVPRALRKNNEGSVTFYIKRCPKCGKEFPKDLFDEWLALLEEKFGIDDFLDPRMKKVPQEYQTDEWWKKRGL